MVLNPVFSSQVLLLIDCEKLRAAFSHASVRLRFAVFSKRFLASPQPGPLVGARSVNLSVRHAVRELMDAKLLGFVALMSHRVLRRVFYSVRGRVRSEPVDGFKRETLLPDASGELKQQMTRISRYGSVEI
jgi:hypothetical protein